MSIARARQPERRKHSIAAGLMLLLCAALLYAVANDADADGIGPYAEIYVAGTGVDIGDLSFNPFFGGITAGYFVRKGIGVEVHAEGLIAEDSDDGFELEYESGFGIAARLESPPQRGTSGYLTLGYSEFTLRQSNLGSPTGPVDVQGDFSGPRVSIGLVQRFASFPSVALSVEFRRYFADESIDVDALVLGLRIATP